MRLIDADSLLVNMDKGMQGTAREYLKFYQMAVNDEPAAYDVDKVIEKLEEEKYEDELYPCNLAVEIEEAKRIVKSGGVD